MKKLSILGGKLALAVALLMVVSGVVSANPVLNFSSSDAAYISFTPDDNSFEFVGGLDGSDFRVVFNNNEFPGGANSLIGYLGYIDGTWTIADTGDPAAVSGVGSIALHTPGSTSTLTGDLEWITVGSSGQGGVLNGGGWINIIFTAMTGNDANLQTLYDMGMASSILTFQLIDDVEIAAQGPEECTGLIGQLRCGPGIVRDDGSVTLQASYSGNVVGEVPEPSTLLLSGAALLALGLLRRRAKV